MKDSKDNVTIDWVGVPKPRGHRPRVYASNAERQAAYRARRAVSVSALVSECQVQGFVDPDILAGMQVRIAALEAERIELQARLAKAEVEAETWQNMYWILDCEYRRSQQGRGS